MAVLSAALNDRTESVLSSRRRKHELDRDLHYWHDLDLIGMEMPLLCGWCLIIDLSPLLEAEHAVTWSKIRGFTLELLERLASSTATTTSLALEIGESTSYVYSYLRNMQKYGLVDVRNYLWHITDTGSLLLFLSLR